MPKRSAVRVPVGFFLAAVWALVSGLTVPMLQSATASLPPQDGKIYWGDSVPKGWNGAWPAHLQTVPEKTRFARTADSTQVLEFLDVLRWKSDKVTVINMFTSPLRRTGTAVVLANPRVATPEEAAKSGKTVVYLQGNIHAYEPEAKEALLMLMRDMLFGKRKSLLDSLVVIVCPNFNVDGDRHPCPQRGNAPYRRAPRTTPRT